MIVYDMNQKKKILYQQKMFLHFIDHRKHLFTVYVTQSYFPGDFWKIIHVI